MKCQRSSSVENRRAETCKKQTCRKHVETPAGAELLRTSAISSVLSYDRENNEEKKDETDVEQCSNFKL